MDQLVHGSRAGATPERPGDCIQQSGFTVAIVSAQHRDVDTLEPQGFVDFGVRHEVSDVERQGNHWAMRFGAARVDSPTPLTPSPCISEGEGEIIPP